MNKNIHISNRVLGLSSFLSHKSDEVGGGKFFRVVYRRDTKKAPVTLWGRDKAELETALNKERIPFVSVVELV